jgi:uncharacterized membrane protein (UPF0136 family)
MSESDSGQMREDLVPADLIEPDEKLVWASRPSVPALVRRTRWVVALVAVVAVVGPVLMWIFLGQLREAAPGIFYALVALIVVADLLPVALMYLMLHAQTRRLIYAITDRRALLVYEGKKTMSRSFTPAELSERQVVRRGGRTGDIYFPAVETSKPGQPMGWIGLEDVDQTDERLGSLAGNSSAGTGA